MGERFGSRRDDKRLAAPIRGGASQNRAERAPNDTAGGSTEDDSPRRPQRPKAARPGFSGSLSASFCYGPGVIAGTTLERIIDPTLGLVFGYGWSSGVSDFIQDHPKAFLSRDDNDIQEWTLPGAITFCGIPVGIHFQFSLDALITIEVQFQLEQFDAAHVEGLVQALGSLFNEDFESPDEGILMIEEDTTRLTFDLIDKRLLFEDMEL